MPTFWTLGLLVAALVQGVSDTYLRAHRAADENLVAGRLAAARNSFSHCLLESPGNAAVAYGLACVESRCDDVEAALEWLLRASEWGYADADVALWDEDLAHVRGDPRFTSLVHAMRDNADRVMYSAEEGGDTPSARIIARTDTPATTTSVIDRDGELAAVGDETGRVVLLEARSGRRLRTWARLASPVLALEFLGDGQELAVLTCDGRLHLGPVDGGGEVASRQAIAPSGGESFGWPFGTRIALAPSRERLLVGAHRRGAGLWSSRGDPLGCWSTRLGSACGGPAPVWTADGRNIVIPGRHVDSGAEKDVVLLDARTGESTGVVLSAPVPIDVVALHPDGRRMATGHEDGSVRIWDLLTRQQLHLYTYVDLFFGDAYVNALAFSPDGSKLACASGTGVEVFLIETGTGQCLWMSDYHGGPMGEPFELHWSADGLALAYGFTSGAMHVFALALTPRFRETTLPRGSPPRVGRNGLAVSSYWGGEQGLDIRSGRVLWMKPRLDGRGRLLHTRAGYFTWNLDSLDGLTISPGYASYARVPLEKLKHALFDPKRVRAARAGVRILPAPL